MIKLSILIPTTPDRDDFILRLFEQFESQLGYYSYRERLDLVAGFIDTYYFNNFPVEIIVFSDNKYYSIGFKRNELLTRATGLYLDFIDSDDRICDNYFKLLFEGINKGVDCCSLKGVITEDGNNPLVFEHSIKYDAYKTNEPSNPIRYERYPNHLNCIKASIAKQFKFPETNHGEDTDWATQIFKSGLLKTEHYIPEVLYYYDYRSKK